MIAIVSYPGGKNGGGAFQKIINQIPPHRVYIEAFVGSGAVLRNKLPAQISYAIDRDPVVIEALTSIIGGVALTGSRHPEAPGDSAESTRLDFDGGAAESPSPPAESAVPPRARSGRSAVPSGSVTDQAVLLSRLRATLPMVDRSSAGSPSRTLPADSPLAATLGNSALGARLICADARTWLAGYKWKGDEFVYCDPPYLGTVRRQARQVYRYEMMTEEEHTALLDVMLAIPCPVMVSGYWSALYGRKLAAWRTLRFQAMTRGGHKMAECLWMNYSEPVELHDYRYLGNNARQRQDIKRMQARWSKKLAEMPAVKRYAILAALAEMGR